MTKARLTKREMTVLLSDVLQQIPPVILKRGLDYYERGLVENVKASGETVTANVQGTESYAVVIDKDWFALASSCSCPYESLCKHVAAVFFALYADYGDPAQLLAEHGTVSRERAGEAFNHDVFLSLTEDQALTQWDAYLEYRLADVVDKRTAYDRDWSRREKRILRRIDELRLAVYPWSASQRLVYVIFAQVVAIRKVLNCLLDSEPGRGSWDFPNEPAFGLAGALTSHLADYVASIEPDELSQIAPQRVDELVLFLRSFLTSTPEHTLIPIQVYQLIWESLLQHATSAIAEAESWFASVTANQGPGVLEGSPGERMPMELSLNETRALTILFVFGGDDLRAQNLLAMSPRVDWEHVATIPASLLRLDAVRRAIVWLRWLEARGNERGQERGHERGNIHFLGEQWLQVGMASEADQDEAVAFIRRHRREHVFLYDQALLAFGHFRTWAEGQLLEGTFPSQLPQNGLRLLEKEDSYLLPIYHQAVERMVAQKNRTAYGHAVRWLKKLRSYYKKQKRVDEWQSFVRRFKAKYSRLRALQEELQRAGIFD